jgi:hypothetical protein
MNRRFLVAVLLLSGLPLLWSEDALWIIREMERRSDNGPTRMIMTMDVYDDASRPDDVRSFRILNLSRDDDTSYMEFVEPRTVNGLRVLSLGRDNWVFFPSTGRVRKIAGSSRRGSVQGIGGDFSYEDLSIGDWEEKYEFTILEAGASRWLLEGRARLPEETYSRVVIAVRRDIVLPESIDFHTREDGHLKTLELSEYRSVSGKLEAGKLVMRNLKKNSKTEVFLAELSFDVAPDARYFEPNRFYR